MAKKSALALMDSARDCTASLCCSSKPGVPVRAVQIASGSHRQSPKRVNIIYGGSDAFAGVRPPLNRLRSERIAVHGLSDANSASANLTRDLDR